MSKFISLIIVTLFCSVALLPSVDPNKVFQFWAGAMIVIYAIDELVKRFVYPPTTDERVKRLVARVVELERVQLEHSKEHTKLSYQLLSALNQIGSLTEIIERIIRLIK